MNEGIIRLEHLSKAGKGKGGGRRNVSGEARDKSGKWKSTADIHAEYVKIRQGQHPDYRFGSDRIYNANSYLFTHAKALTTFKTDQFHPDSVAAVRQQAKDSLKQQATLRSYSKKGAKSKGV